MCSHTFIEVMYYAGQNIFVVAHSRLAYYILLFLASHRVITYMFSPSRRRVYLGGTCIYTLLEFHCGCLQTVTRGAFNVWGGGGGVGQTCQEQSVV
jgi:hypothetical protein